jgi:hypothetical protein
VLYIVRRPCFAPLGIDVTLGICFAFFLSWPYVFAAKTWAGNASISG